MKIRALIVDDEPLARQRVRLLLDEKPDGLGKSEPFLYWPKRPNGISAVLNSYSVFAADLVYSN